MADEAWGVEFSDRASRALRRLPRATQDRVIAAVERLAADGSGDVKRLAGQPGTHRLRVGDYRVIFRYRASDGVIDVANLGHRREIYRR